MRTREIPPHLHDRYGVRPPSKWRWVGWGAALLTVLPVGVYAASRYVAAQDRPFALIRWASASGGTSVSVMFRATADGGTRWCAVRAQDFDHVDVGFALVPVRAGSEQVTLDMRVLERPVAVDVIDCSADPYALPGPQFAPGVLPPAQQPPVLAPGAYTEDQMAALG